MTTATVLQESKVYDNGKRVFSESNPVDWNNANHIINKPTLVTGGASLTSLSFTEKMEMIGVNKPIIFKATSEATENCQIYLDSSGTLNITGKVKFLQTGNESVIFQGEVLSKDDIGAFYSSDLRLKDNIKPIFNALGLLQEIDGVAFNYKSRPNATSLGVIAQDVEEVLPMLVSKGSDGFLGVQYIGFIPILIEAVKQLDDRLSKFEKFAGVK